VVFASDTFVGVSTLGLALATFVLAGAAIWQLKEARKERRAATKSLEIAEATLRTEQRPELIALEQVAGDQREVHLAAHGSVWKRPGRILVETEILQSSVGVVSFEVLNIGRGAAAISSVRLMSLDTIAQGGDPAYWEPDISMRRLIVVPASGFAPVDLVLAPQPPSWFYGHMQSGNKFWVEIVYSDLGGVEEHVRWFEFQRRPQVEPAWFISQVLLSMPSQFSNLPPGNPLVEAELS
jgi:hypothetical protein